MKTNVFSNAKNSFSLSLACVGLLSTMGATSALADGIFVDGSEKGSSVTVSGSTSSVEVKNSGTLGASSITVSGGFSGSININANTGLNSLNYNKTNSGGSLQVDGSLTSITGSVSGGGSVNWTVGSNGEITAVKLGESMTKSLSITNSGNILGVTFDKLTISGGSTITNKNEMGNVLFSDLLFSSGSLTISNDGANASIGDITFGKLSGGGIDILSINNTGAMGAIKINGPFNSGATSGATFSLNNSGVLDGLTVTGKFSVASGGATLATIANSGTINGQLKFQEIFTSGANIDITNSGVMNGFEAEKVTIQIDGKSPSSFKINNSGTFGGINITSDLQVISGSGSINNLFSVSNTGNLGGATFAKVTLSGGSVELTNNGGDFGGLAINTLTFDKTQSKLTINNTAGNFGDINISNGGSIVLKGSGGGAGFNEFNISNAGVMGEVSITPELNLTSGGKVNFANTGSIGSINFGTISVNHSGGEITTFTLSNTNNGSISAINVANTIKLDASGASLLSINNTNATIGSLNLAGIEANSASANVANSGRINALSLSGKYYANGASGSTLGFTNSKNGVISNFSIAEGATFSTVSGGVISIANDGSISAFNNAGSLSAEVSFQNRGTIDALTNTSAGTISTTLNNASNSSVIGSIVNAGKWEGSGSVAITNNGGVINSIANNANAEMKEIKITRGSVGSISNVGGSISSIANSGTIGAIDNSGTINSISSSANKSVIASIANRNKIDNITASSKTTINSILNDGNIGTISIDNSAVASIANNSIISEFKAEKNSTIGEIVNKGTISNDITISASKITDITNSGEFSKSITFDTRSEVSSFTNRGAIASGITNAANSVIGTFNNSGLTKIDNKGTITSLSNTYTGTAAGGRFEYQGSGVVSNLDNSGIMYATSPILLTTSQDENGNQTGLLNNTGTISAVGNNAIIGNSSNSLGTVRVVNTGKMLLSSDNGSAHILSNAGGTLNVENWNLSVDKGADSFNRIAGLTAKAASDSSIVVSGNDIGKITFAPQSIKINVGNNFEFGKAYSLGNLVVKNSNGTLTQAGTVGTAAYQYNEQTGQFEATQKIDSANVVNNGQGLNVSHIVATNPLYTFSAATITTTPSANGTGVYSQEDGFQIGVDVGQGAGAILSQSQVNSAIRRNNYAQNVLRGSVGSMQTQMRTASAAYADARMSEEYDTSSLSHYAAVGSDFVGMQGSMNPQNRSILGEATNVGQGRLATGTNINYAEVNNHAFIMPYFVKDSTTLTNDSESKNTGYGVMLGYQRNAGSAGIFGVFAGFEMDDAYTEAADGRSRIDHDSDSINGGISYYRDLIVGNTANLYLRTAAKVGVSSLSLKQEGDTAKPQEVTFGAELGFGYNIFATSNGSQIFTPEVSVSYDYATVREYTLNGVKYDDSQVNLVLAQLGLNWGAQWVPGFRTEIGGGVRWNLNKRVDSKVILSSVTNKDSIDMPDLYSYGQASFIFSVNEFLDLSLNYTGSFSNKSQSHVGAFKLGFWW